MSAIAPRLYVLPCCGRRSLQPPVAGRPCFDCALAATPLDDPIAVAYRKRVADRAAAPSLVPEAPEHA